MSTLVERIREAKEAGDFRAMAEAIPYNRFMGIGVEEHDGELLGVMRFADHLVGNFSIPALHGGTLGALLESTAIFTLLWRSETVVLPKTITITVDYLRPARILDTWARASITRHGRRVVSVRVEAWQEDPDRKVAAANAHFLVKAD